MTYLVAQTVNNQMMGFLLNNEWKEASKEVVLAKVGAPIFALVW
jgi:hypothetical protein